MTQNLMMHQSTCSVIAQHKMRDGRGLAMYYMGVDVSTDKLMFSVVTEDDADQPDGSEGTGDQLECYADNVTADEALACFANLRWSDLAPGAY